MLRLKDSLLIFSIGISSLLFDELKQNVQRTTIPQKILKHIKQQLQEQKIKKNNKWFDEKINQMFLQKLNQQMNSNNKMKLLQQIEHQLNNVKTKKYYERHSKQEEIKNNNNKKDIKTINNNSKDNDNFIINNDINLMYYRLLKLTKWKLISSLDNVSYVIPISFLHSIGGYFYPSVFFLSIFSYFVVYQVNFIADYLILTKKSKQVQYDKKYYQQNLKFKFEKINQFYLYASLIGLGMVGFNKGIKYAGQRIAKKIDNQIKK